MTGDITECRYVPYRDQQRYLDTGWHPSRAALRLAFSTRACRSPRRELWEGFAMAKLGHPVTTGVAIRGQVRRNVAVAGDVLALLDRWRAARGLSQAGAVRMLILQAVAGDNIAQNEGNAGN